MDLARFLERQGTIPVQLDLFCGAVGYVALGWISVMELDGDFTTPHNCLRVS
jgi:hypothetical protein